MTKFKKISTFFIITLILSLLVGTSAYANESGRILNASEFSSWELTDCFPGKTYYFLVPSRDGDVQGEYNINIQAYGGNISNVTFLPQNDFFKNFEDYKYPVPVQELNIGRYFSGVTNYTLKFTVIGNVNKLKVSLRKDSTPVTDVNVPFSFPLKAMKHEYYTDTYKFRPTYTGHYNLEFGAVFDASFKIIGCCGSDYHIINVDSSGKSTSSHYFDKNTIYTIKVTQRSRNQGAYTMNIIPLHLEN